MGRTLLSILAVVALIWSIYIGIALVQSNIKLTPSTVFSEADKKIIVIHNTAEIDLNTFKFRTSFYRELAEHPERIQHFYFSMERSNVLLERSKPWTTDLVDRYFSELRLKPSFSSGKKFTLSNGWSGSFDRYFIHLEKEPIEISETTEDYWKYIDLKASYSSVNTAQGNHPTNNYYINTTGIINYSTQLTQGQSKLIDDQDLFQGIIPASFQTYEFISKQRLVRQASAQSPVLTWIKSGLCILQLKEGIVYVTDKKPGQEPYAILGLTTEFEKKRFKKTFVSPHSIGGKEEQPFFLETFNDWVIFSTRQAAIDAVIGNYEIGATLAQSEDLETIIGDAPKEVSYRKITTRVHKTVSDLMKSQLIYSFNYTAKDRQTPSVTEQLWTTEQPFKIETGISQVYTSPSYSTIIVKDNSGQLLGIAGQQLLWKHTIDGSLLREPVFTQNEELNYLSTTGSVALSLRTGNARIFKPTSGNLNQPVEQINYRGAIKYVGTQDRNLILFAENGQVERTYTLPLRMDETSLLRVENKPKETLVHLFMGNKKVSYSLDKKRSKISTLYKNYTSFMAYSNELVVGLHPNGIDIMDVKGRIVRSKTLSSVQRVRPSYQPDVLLIETADRWISWNTTTQEESSLQLPLSQNQLSSYCITQRNALGARLDLIANDIELITHKEHPLNGKHVEGSVFVEFHNKNGETTLITQSNDYLIRYILKKL